MLKQNVLIVALVLFGAACGGVHDVGRDTAQGQQSLDGGADGQTEADAGVDECSTHSDCPDGACVLGVCRVACGSNYPGVVCPQGEACDEWICRPTCDSPCAAGTACSADGVCEPTSCSANTPCEPRGACSDGTCVAIGALCSADSSCTDTRLTCSNGSCKLPCGPNYPNNHCEPGATCNTDGVCEYQ